MILKRKKESKKEKTQNVDNSKRVTHIPANDYNNSNNKCIKFTQ